MVDVDELEEELERQDELLERLIRRSKQQSKDIKKMKREISKLSFEIEDEETISPEQEKNKRSGEA